MIKTFSNHLKQARKARRFSQEQLAEKLGITVQAVSKWECALSYPDVELLVPLADFLGVSVDELFRENADMNKATIALPDDDKLRIVQCKGRTVLGSDAYDPDVKIPLIVDKKTCGDGVCPQINLEIWGSANINGSISGKVIVGSSLNCGKIERDATAGRSINCGNISGEVRAGNHVTCGTINGNIISCAGDIHCHMISGNAACDGNIYYDKPHT